MGIKMSLGKIVGLLAVLYTVLATPWYLSRDVHPQVLGLPLWAFLTVLIILALGYAIYFVSRKIEGVLSSG